VDSTGVEVVRDQSLVSLAQNPERVREVGGIGVRTLEKETVALQPRTGRAAAYDERGEGRVLRLARPLADEDVEGCRMTPCGMFRSLQRGGFR
jgi:hypothetical protein